MQTKLRWTAVPILCLALIAGAAAAQSAPQLINYQGRIANALGQPPADGSTVDLTFKFYSAAAGGALFLTVLQPDVVVTNGLYNVLIGSGTITPGMEISLANVFRNHPEVWLGVAVDADLEMTPRSRIASVPYALNCAAPDLGAIQKFLREYDYDGDGHEKDLLGEGHDDCDDSEPRVYAGAPEVCDGIDNQCLGDAGYGQVDEGCGACEDLDADGYGWGCAAGPDCDDLDHNNWNSCATCSDLDSDGMFVACDDYVTLAGPDCDDLDLNNWTACATCVDTDADTWFAGCDDYVTIDGPDCDDLQPVTYPGAPETCRDGLDNQCPGDTGYGSVDEDCPMAFIPSGCFNMGDSIDSCSYNSNECPVHNVCITSSFFMDRHEVTNAEYAACVSGGGCTPLVAPDSHTRFPYHGNPAYDNYPLIHVSWSQATAFCAWAGNRLPTEAEWEYAARGGLSGKRYPGGDSITCADADIARYTPSFSCYNYGGLDNDTHPAVSYVVNGYGLYGMTGNVWEWTNDWYSDTYYATSPLNDPTGPTTGSLRVVRGGSWIDEPQFQRAAARFPWALTDLNRSIGFRCAGD